MQLSISQCCFFSALLAWLERREILSAIQYIELTIVLFNSG